MISKSIWIIVFLLSVLLSPLESSCIDGCIACGKSSDGSTPVCQICDIFRSYVRASDGVCHQKEIPNCAIPSSQFDEMACFKCKEGFVLNHPSKTCSVVPTSFKVTNCKYYHWNFRCIECQADYYLNGNECTVLPAKIPNCRLHQDPKTCKQCNYGFYYEKNSKTCMSIQQVKDCLVYSSSECLTCSAGYFKISNFLSGISFDPLQIQYIVTYFQEENSNVFHEENQLNNCIRGGVANCLTHEFFDKCTQCMSGYFLTQESKCQASPPRQVANCWAYSSGSNCINCKIGFYLKNNFCYMLDEVKDCLQYDDSNRICIECSLKTHYLSAGICIARAKSLSIENCQTLNSAKDYCEQCIESYVLTDDKLKCLPHTPHCKEYVRSPLDATSSSHLNLDSTTLLCQMCQDHYYRSSDSKECITQSSPNCIEFISNSNDCNKCASGYFKELKKCKPYIVINCKKYQSESNQCESCYDGFYFFKQQCFKHTVNNCKTFSATLDECVDCFFSFYKDQISKDCLPRTTLGCNQFEMYKDECKTCYPGFYKDTSTKSCLSIALRNCAMHQTDQNNCSSCLSGYYKDTASNECKPYTVASCEIKDSGKDQCTKCNSGYFKTPFANQCRKYSVTSCKDYEETSDECTNCLPNHFKYLTNCLPIVFKNCNTPDYSKNTCETCDNGYEKRENLCIKISRVGCDQYNLDVCTGCQSGYYLANDLCRVHSLANCSTYNAISNKCDSCVKGYKLVEQHCIPWNISHCSKYDYSQSSETCLECVQGFRYDNTKGCILQDIPDCVRYTFNSNNCVQCRVGFSLFENVCSEVNHIFGCVRTSQANPSKCLFCSEGYYLDPSDSTCKVVTAIPNCIKYFENSKKCKYCEYNKKLNSSFSACEDIPDTTNCESYQFNSAKCLVCLPGYYLSNSQSCESQKVPKCSHYVNNQNKCLVCEKGYKDSSGSCVSNMSDIPNCLRLNVTLAECDICSKGYYLSEGKCQLQDLPGCLLYILNINHCVKCTSGYELINSKCYLYSATSDNCYRHVKGSPVCELCLPAFKMDSSGTCVLRTITNKVVDTECNSNKGSDDTSCTRCNEGQSSIFIAKFKYNGDFTGCKTIDASLNCTQCLPGYQALTAGQKKCTKYSGSSAVCRQQISTTPTAKTLEDPGDCLQCIDSSYFIISNTCGQGDLNNCNGYSNVSSCSKLPYKSAAQTFPSEDIYECVQKTKAPKYQMPANCLAMKTDLSKCEICAEDYKNENGVCSNKIAADSIPFFGPTGIITKKDNAASNAQYLVQASYEGSLTRPAQCKRNQLMVDISFLAPNFNKRSGHGYVNYESNSFENMLSAVEFFPSFYKWGCLNNSGNKYLSADGVSQVQIAADLVIDASTGTTSCSIWYLDEAANCLGCRGNKYPVVKSLPNVYQNGTITDNLISNDMMKFGVSDCITIPAYAASLTKSYQGLNYHNLENLTYSVFLNFDHCDSADHFMLVFIGLTQDSYLLMPYQWNLSSTNAGSILCIKYNDSTYLSTSINNASTSWKYNIPGGVANCQINSFVVTKDQNLTSKFDMSSAVNGSSFKCMSCRPGYTPYTAGSTVYTSSGNSLISECNKISKCKTSVSSENTWMNACETCDDNYAWSYNSTEKYTLFHVCVTSITKPNCMVIDGSNCRMCKMGYTLNKDNECIDISQDPYCEEKGFGKYDFMSGGTYMIDLTLLQYLYSKGSTRLNTNYCNKCSGDRVLFNANAKSNLITSNAYFLGKANLKVANCLVESTVDTTKCNLCSSGHVAVTNNSSKTYGDCQSITSLTVANNSLIVPANCRAIENASTNTCLVCETNLILWTSESDPTKQHCFSEEDITLNCDTFNSTDKVCDICQKNYLIDPENTYKCKDATSFANYSCLRDTYDGRCLTCKDLMNFPIHQYDSTISTRLKYTYTCVLQTSLKMVPFENNVIAINSQTKTMSVKIDKLPSDYHYSTDPSIATFATDVPTKIMDVCLKFDFSSSMPNCLDFLVDGYRCSRCKPNYFYTYGSSITCTSISLSNCAHKDSDGLCIVCEDGYSLTNNGSTCSNRNVSNCVMYNPITTKCSLCSDSYYLDDSANECKSYSYMNYCELRNPLSDNCLKCQHSYHLDNNNNCDKNSIANCKMPNSLIKHHCDHCQNDYYLQNGVCVYQKKVMFCSTWDEQGNCQSCLPGYFLESEVCKFSKTNVVPGCNVYDILGYLCLRCNPGLIMMAGFCMKKSLGNCLELYEGTLSCKTCESGFYNQQGLCTKRQVLNCFSYLDDSEGCRTCNTGYYLSNGECREYSATNCLDYNAVYNQCLSCKVNYYLDRSDNFCKPVSVSNCLIYHQFKDYCTSCKRKFYRTNEGKCLPQTEINCETHDPYNDSCIKCKPTYYLIDEPYVVNSKDLSNKCQRYTIQYCSKFHPSEDLCLSCAQGYFLHSVTNQCTILSKKNCSSWDSTLSGCEECPENFYLSNGVCYLYSASNCYTFNSTKDACTSCIENFYLAGEICEAYSIWDCKSYHPTKNLCQTCIHGFYIENGRCSPVNQPNCNLPSNISNTCLECNPSFYLKNGKCYSYSVSCLRYNPKRNSCITCPRGMYFNLFNQTCNKYSIKKCSSYSFNSDRCTSCVPNFYLSNGFCIKYSVVNCKKRHPLLDECMTCPKGFYYHQKDCKVYTVSNCVQYSLVSDICLTCLAGHYNDNSGNCIEYHLKNCSVFDPNQNSCLICKEGPYYRQERSNDQFDCLPIKPVQNCQKYELSQNRCKQCQDNFYYDQSKNICNKNSSSILYCLEYINEKTCKKCVAPYYVTGNQCKKSQQEIPNCIGYNTTNVCGECKNTYLLSSDKKNCLRIKESSCKEYKDISNCSSCSDNNVLVYINEENPETRRAVCAPSGIENCVKAIEAHPNHICQKCESNYFLVSKYKCTAVINKIEGCEAYFVNGICSECAPNMLLSADKKKCLYDISFLGMNCEEGKFLNEPKCFLCKPGSYLDTKGNCQKCLMTGCAICSNLSLDNCRLCKNGYFMGSDYRCSRIGSLNLNSRVETDSGVGNGLEASNSSTWNILGGIEMLKYDLFIFLAIVALFQSD